MSNFWQRVFLFIVPLPLLIGSILYLPFYHHLVFNILVVVFTVGGAWETRSLFINRFPTVGLLPVVLSALFPISAYLEISGAVSFSLIPLMTIIILTALFLKLIFIPEGSSTKPVITQIAGSLFIVFYPGFFTSFATYLSAMPKPGATIIAFLFIVYANDTFAYIFGNLFGKSSRKIFAVSPNKSLVGFIGGFFGSLTMAYLSYLIVPSIYSNKFYLWIIAGAAIGLAAIAGDLVESSLKRSAKVKDSGNVIPGRGGILDTIDSVFFSVPFFYYILLLGQQL
jgi:phosphatidate cytidylyltransferase